MASKLKRVPVYLTGDRNLIEELAASMAGKNVTLSGSTSGLTSRVSLPKGMKRAAKAPRTTKFAFELSHDPEVKKKNLRMLERSLSAQAVIFSSAVCQTVAEQSEWIKNPRRLVGICAFPTLLGRPLVEVSAGVHTDASALAEAKSFFALIGKEMSIVQDRVGMVMPRVLCMVINEAAFALMDQIASPADIDTAMKLGTNYPEGPVTWGDAIGFESVERVLLALCNDLREERYRPAPLLRQLALGHRWWEIGSKTGNPASRKGT